MNETIESIEKRIKRLEVTPLQKMLYIIACMFGIAIITAYIMYIFGNRYFVLPLDNYFQNKFIDYSISNILFLFQMILIFNICGNYSFKYVFLGSILIMATKIIFEISGIDFIFISFILPLIVVIILSYFQHKKIKYTIYNIFFYLLALLIFNIYCYFVQPVKTGYLFNGVLMDSDKIGTISQIILSIDILLFLVLLIFIRKAVYNYDDSMVLGILPRGERYNPTYRYGDKVREKINSYRGAERLIAQLVKLALNIIPILLIGGACALDNVFIEFIVIYVSFVAVRNIFKLCWHSSNFIYCTLCSFVVFYLLAKGVIPLRYSILCAMFIGAMTSIVMAKIKIYTDEYKEQTKTIYKQADIIVELRNQSKQLYALKQIRLTKGMNKADLIDSCKFKQLSDQEIEMLTLKYVDCILMKEIVAKMDTKYGIGRTTVFKYMDIAERKYQDTH